MKTSPGKFGVIVVMALALLLLAEPALAANVLDTTVSKFGDATAVFGSRIKGAAVSLLLTLAGIQLAVNMVMMMLKEMEFTALVGSVVRWMITTALFFTFITFSSVYLPAIINSFSALGQQGSGLGELTPSSIITQGIELQSVMIKSFNAATGADGGGITGMVAALKSFFPAIMMAIICLIIFASFAILAAQMALTMISGYMWLCITPLLLGFGGLSFTKDIAVNSLKGGIAIGMKILVVYLIAGVAGTLAPILGVSMNDVTLMDWSPMYWTLAVSMIIAYLSFQLPKVAADLMNGTASLSAGDAGTNMVMMAAAAAGAGAVAGGVGVAAGKAALGGMQSAAAGAGGLAKALGAGYSAAADAGKTGVSGAASAVGQVASQGAGMAMQGIGSKISGLAGGGGFSEKVASSTGGRIAEKIEAGRGGSMGPAAANSAPQGSAAPASNAAPGASATPSAGATPAASAIPSTSETPAASTASSASETPAVSPPKSSAASPANAASAPASNLGGFVPSSSTQQSGTMPSAPGDASTASISGGAAPAVPPPKQGGQRTSIDEKIRKAERFMPQDSHTVGLAASLTSQHHE